MPRHRTPKTKAYITGQAVVRRKKFESRKEPTITRPVGAPPSWMDADQRKAWELFNREILWLNYSHRGLLEICSVIRGSMASGAEVDIPRLNSLRQCLGQLGASPVDASR
jgi:hypothetical protein